MSGPRPVAPPMAATTGAMHASVGELASGAGCDTSGHAA
ncbi:protein of unassigned function [Methylobacterium oryzae CBMB20]|uniref:Protein of unassigned function n=1 Tax=Methylobacterium oryzae CBMB20 TaxID=693986 RepID=A0A089NPR0_9HYPH|nr:protein of unassigned function [Methylobacterium oryzae CBMB20]